MTDQRPHAIRIDKRSTPFDFLPIVHQFQCTCGLHGHWHETHDTAFREGCEHVWSTQEAPR